MKVVGCIPAGRRRYLEVLVPHILRHRAVFSDFQLWANTLDPHDMQYLYRLQQETKGFFRVVPPEEPVTGVRSLCHFWKHVRDPEAIYVRFDDDVVWMDSDAIPRLVEHRLRHPEPFLVYGNTINSAHCSFLHHRFGCIPFTPEGATLDGMKIVGWENGPFAELVHRSFLKHLHADELDQYRFSRWVFFEYEQAAINVCSWFGRDIRENEPLFMHGQEERWVATERPRELGRPTEICGQALFVHFAFWRQREHLEASGLLDQYRILCPR